MGHVEDNEVIRASVWIRPGGTAGHKLQDAINRVQRRAGGPGGHPHLTLLAGIECTRAQAEARLKKLAARIHPFSVKLGEIDFRNEYYRCLYVRVLPSPELAAAQRAAHAAFEMNPPDPFEPRVSLLYGEESTELKRELAAELSKLVSVSFAVEKLELVNAAPGVPVSQWCTLAQHDVLHGAPATRLKKAGVPYSAIGGG